MDLHQQLTNLFASTADAYQEAASKNGCNLAWPFWYAERLHRPIETLFHPPLTMSELVVMLIAAEHSLRCKGGSPSWAEFYADYFIQHYCAD